MNGERSDPLDAAHALISNVATTAAPLDDDDDAPMVTEYGDLLDAKWLEREGDELERDEELVEVGLTLDLNDEEDDDESAYVMDLDVGTLLTPLLPAEADADSAESEWNDGSLTAGALRDVLLPEQAQRQRAEDDEAVGDDEQFPAFDETEGMPDRSGVDEDGSEGTA